MKTKSQIAKELWQSGEIVKALKIFKSFKIGYTADEQRTLQIAYESMAGSSGFYESIGIDTAAMIKKAKEIITRKIKKDERTNSVI